jgi:uncharacterized protein (TIGR02246 family)
MGPVKVSTLVLCAALAALAPLLGGCVVHMVAHSIAADQTETFNKHDVDAIAASFTTDAVMVTADGSRLVGQEAIKAYLKRLFAAAPDIKMELVDIDTTSVGGGYKNTAHFKLAFANVSATLEMVSMTRKEGSKYLTYDATWTSATKLPDMPGAADSSGGPAAPSPAPAKGTAAPAGVPVLDDNP